MTVYWVGWIRGRINVAAFVPFAGPSCHRYWPVAALSVVETRTDTTLVRLMITPFCRSRPVAVGC